MYFPPMWGRFQAREAPKSLKGTTGRKFDVVRGEFSEKKKGAAEKKAAPGGEPLFLKGISSWEEGEFVRGKWSSKPPARGMGRPR